MKIPDRVRAGRGVRRRWALGFVLALATIALAGCYYVVPAPPPPPGAAPAVPQFVRERPQCGWTYGMGWYGWAWYGALPC
jgi:hypothetical protein